MTPLKRRIAAVSVPALLALSLTACGGGAPTDASKADFCDAYGGVADVFTDADPEDEKALADALNKAGDKLEEVGTPDGISDEEREGFEVEVKAYQDIDEDAIKDLSEAEGEDETNDALGVSSDDTDKAEKFESYASETCSDA